MKHNTSIFISEVTAVKKKYIIVMAGFCLLFLGIIAAMYVPKKASSGHSDMLPVVFMHGYKGTENSFGHMLSRFEKKNWGNKALVYVVSAEGDIRGYNLGKGTETPEFIQIVFENNRASFQDSAMWLAGVMEDIKENYQINSINLVGHSMGGIVSLKYVLEYQDPDVYPTVNKLITIGSPFDGIYSREYFRIHQDAGANDLMPRSEELEQLLENRHAFPVYTQALSIGSTGDVVAVPESVRTLRNIIPEEQLQEIMISDQTLGHSALHEDERVDYYIHSFLWQNKGQ
jgi:uncharacterized alpha/beta hydrolase family protein